MMPIGNSVCIHTGTKPPPPHLSSARAYSPGVLKGGRSPPASMAASVVMCIETVSLSRRRMQTCGDL